MTTKGWASWRQALSLCAALRLGRHALGTTAEDFDVGAAEEGSDVTAQPLRAQSVATPRFGMELFPETH
jgi:hypothetical protein